MALELFYDDSEERVRLGATGEYAVSDVRALLEQLDPDAAVHRIELDLGVDEPFSLAMPGGSTVTATAPGGADAAVAPGARLQRDSVPFFIVKLLADRDESLRTAEIADALEGDLSQNAVASRLWNLANRGLVEKRPFPEDRRQKVYQLTAAGSRALERAEAREG